MQAGGGSRTKSGPLSLPPDHDQRLQIETALDRNVLVEAAAGTGKTTSMLGRMTALLRTGKCENISRLAAVTFTRKAASELRARFQISLERAVPETQGPERENLRRALAGSEQCFIGTIHSFCGRLLRERPVESGVDLAFQEIDETADARLRGEAWAEYQARLLIADSENVLAELDRLGLQLDDLENGFRRFADFPDVSEWPVPDEGSALPDLREAVGRVREYTDHMRRLGRRLPEEGGRDALIPAYRGLPRIVCHYEDLSRPAALMEVLGRFDRNPGLVQKEWTKNGAFTKDEAKQEEARWNRFREEVVQPLLRRWHEMRYGPVIRIFRGAAEIYDRMRQERGLLNYQDLLIKAAGLLRDKPHVREYFRDRYRFLLVDEFQDTDPIQAEVMLLLVATEPAEQDWRRCRPRPGSLFVVGDPKQSIYRFRRADIVIYNEVKDIIRRGSGPGEEGLIVQLSANFRTSAPIIDWVNAVFRPEATAGESAVTGWDAVPASGRGVGADPGSGPRTSGPAGRRAKGRLGSSAGDVAAKIGGGEQGGEPGFDGRSAAVKQGAEQEAAIPQAGTLQRFPAVGSRESPAYVPLRSAREEGAPGDLAGVHVLKIPAAYSSKEQIAAYEADRIARTIRHALDSGKAIPRTRQQLDQGASLRPDPSDFLIVTWKKERLSTLGRLLQEYGIPHQVTGGTALNELPELRLLYICLKSLCRPDDPVALVGALRSELLGFSDRALYAFKKAGGRFSFRKQVPEVLCEHYDEDLREAFRDAFGRFMLYSEWLARMPVLTAIEKIVADLGLAALAASRPGGDVQAGGLAKTIEMLRAVERETWSLSQAVDYLAGLLAGEEAGDGISARSQDKPVVRVMNLHKVKGLEAPVVFLADPYGDYDHPADLYLERSGNRVRGFMAVYGEKKGFGPAPLLAQPAGWETLAEREARFGDAEVLRLRYVAATRAGSCLIVTQREGGRDSSPWKYFVDFLAGAPEIPDPGGQTAPTREQIRVAEGEAAAAENRVKDSFTAVLEGTFRVSGVKDHVLAQARQYVAMADDHASAAAGVQLWEWCESGMRATEEPLTSAQAMRDTPVQGDALLDSADDPFSAGAEHGMKWGTVIHLLFERAMDNPEADLEALARSALAEQELDPDLMTEAVDLVRAVMQSGIWQRALASSRHFTELPFELIMDQAAALPELLRGKIDLAFREQDGWVIVDYKTDLRQGRGVAEVPEVYANQVRLYGQAFSRATGERVKEAGLFWVRERRYESVDVSGSTVRPRGSSGSR